jgi:hypothetical protein
MARKREKNKKKIVPRNTNEKFCVITTIYILIAVSGIYTYSVNMFFFIEVM